jgi:hypothetical protein
MLGLLGLLGLLGFEKTTKNSRVTDEYKDICMIDYHINLLDELLGTIQVSMHFKN